MVTPLTIDGRTVGPGAPCFIIAEAGVNHNGSVERARQLIDVAVNAQVDAVKFQMFKAESLMTADAPKAAYQILSTGTSESQMEMIRKLELRDHDVAGLADYCRSKNLLFLSTPFDAQSADFLEALGIPAFKVGSGELTNSPLLVHIARKGRPMLLSTGMSYLNEVAAAVECVRQNGCAELALLHCVSNYPAAAKEVNLRAMATMSESFDVPVGYSDHTSGMTTAIAAVALGACIIEKHFTTDRSLPGPDHRASLEPRELAALARAIRDVESALGHGRKEPAPSEADTAAVARRSLVAACDIPAGTVLHEKLVAILRPGTGLPPSMRNQLIGRTTRVPIPIGTLLTLEMLA